MPLIKCSETTMGNRIIKGERPEIAVSIFDSDADSLISSFTSGNRRKDALYEIRYDLFHTKSTNELGIILAFLEGMQADYIFTFRSDNPDELSEYYGVASDLGTKCADIETGVYDSIRKSVNFNTLMLSHHSYTGESVLDTYNAILKEKPQIIKLASEYTSYASFQEDFISLQERKKKDGFCLSFIPMGERNSFLRIMSAYVLSDIVYAREAEGTAGGQFTEEQYRKFFSTF